MLALAAATASAQPTPVFRAGLDLVNVTVTVRDGKGGLVADLTADDFVVREDGRPQKVEIFAPAARPEERRGAGPQPRHALRHEREHAEGPQAEPGVGHPLPRRDSPRAGPPAHLLRPRHPDLALQLREPAGHLRADPGGEGRGLHRALRRDRRLRLSRRRDARPQGAGDLHRRRRHDEPGAAPRGAEARSLDRGHDLPGGLPRRAPAEHRGRAPGPLLPRLARRGERRPGLPAARRRASWPASTSRSWTSSARSTSSATCRTTRSTTASSAGSPSS